MWPPYAVFVAQPRVRFSSSLLPSFLFGSSFFFPFYSNFVFVFFLIRLAFHELNGFIEVKLRTKCLSVRAPAFRSDGMPFKSGLLLCEEFLGWEASDRGFCSGFVFDERACQSVMVGQSWMIGWIVCVGWRAVSPPPTREKSD